MLLCFSIDHRVAGLDLLERIERHTGAIVDALNTSRPARGHVVIATCNRFELYLDSAAPHGPDAMSETAIDLLATHTEISRSTLELGIDRYINDEAAEHLFAVTSGLRSAAIGEGEIAGQVRRAHIAAQEQGSLTDALERLFQTAVRTSRTVKHRTGLQGTGRSLVRLALAIAERRIASWNDARVVLVGTGAYAGAATAALRDRGVTRFGVYSPSGRAQTFATSHGLDVIANDSLAHELDVADLVITCSGSTVDPVLTVDDITRLATDRSRLFLDLGVPRNVDPAVAQLAGVELLDIETIAKHASVEEFGAESEALSIVQHAAAEFASSRAELGAVPTVLALREHVFEILEEELCRARKGSGGNAGTIGNAGGTETALRRFAGRLLHEPTVRLRALGRAGRGDEAAAAAAALFGLETVQPLDHSGSETTDASDMPSSAAEATSFEAPGPAAPRTLRFTAPQETARFATALENDLDAVSPVDSILTDAAL